MLCFTLAKGKVKSELRGARFLHITTREPQYSWILTQTLRNVCNPSKNEIAFVTIILVLVGCRISVTL